jgi:hypothetical protein
MTATALPRVLSPAQLGAGLRASPGTGVGGDQETAISFCTKPITIAAHCGLADPPDWTTERPKKELTRPPGVLGGNLLQSSALTGAVGL